MWLASVVATAHGLMLTKAMRVLFGMFVYSQNNQSEH